jgi:hypothetical protein
MVYFPSRFLLLLFYFPILFTMMGYDDWLVENEHNYRGWNDPEHECPECGKPQDKEGYCSGTCFEASLL